MAAAGMGNAEAEHFKAQADLFNNFMTKNSDYSEKLKELLEADKGVSCHRFEVNLADLDAYKSGLLRDVLEDPKRYLPAFEHGLHQFSQNGEGMKKTAQRAQKRIRIGITGAFGRNHVTPRGLNCRMVTQMVSIEGVVTSVTPSLAKLTQSIHYCEETGETQQRKYRDNTALAAVDAYEIMGGAPKEDKDGNPYTQEFGMCTYKDQQKIVIQEAPENAPTGMIPISVEAIIEEDMCDTVRPGDRVRCIGVYKAFPKVTNGMTSGVMPCRIIANNVQAIRTQVLRQHAHVKDISNIRAIAKTDDFLTTLASSFAPSISGSLNVKKGLLLAAVGGAEKNFTNGTHLRGDINILLVGDPSCGKSQMCRFVMNMSQMSVSTTGRGSSGVGLTAAINVDARTGEKTLQAGAMVLGDRGTVIIDEFDKMSINDRVAIHEVMEQQTVTIAKAGMHVTLNARCTVIAAANPLHSNWDDRMTLTQNINLPDSLLSRFDLIYVMKDEITEERDRQISDQILRQLMYRDEKRMDSGRGNDDVHDSKLEKKAEEDKENKNKPTEVYEQKHPGAQKDGAGGQMVTVEFLKKYLAFCKQREDPELSKEACHLIGVHYAALRQQFVTDESAHGQLAVTTRTLEAMIRLATAHAKLRLGTEVTPQDVEVTRALLMESRGMPIKGTDDVQADGSRKRAREEDDDGGRAAKRLREEGPEDSMDQSRFVKFRQETAGFFSEKRIYNCMEEELKDHLMNVSGFSENEVRIGLNIMVEQKKMMGPVDGQYFLSL